MYVNGTVATGNAVSNWHYDS